MSLLDLRGPQFLVFYGALGAATVLALWWWRKRREAGDPPSVDVSDAYLLAYLRGGASHACSVATISLVDRGLLEVSEESKLKARTGSGGHGRRPIERAVLDHFQGSAQEARSIFSVEGTKGACEEYRTKLAALGLLPDARVWSERATMLIVALGLLWLVAGMKVAVAFSRGRRNVQFLLILAVLFSIAAAFVTLRRQTALGARLLADLRGLFDGLKNRSASIVPGGSTNEAAILAAVFGLALLPERSFPYAKKLYPKAASSAGSGCGTSGGSSCGGGCGGGCGGCGS